jgi:hypothetical protein
MPPGFLTILNQAVACACLQWLMQHEQLFVADARRKEMAMHASLASRLLSDWLPHGPAPFVCPAAVTLVRLVILLWGAVGMRREMMPGRGGARNSLPPTWSKPMGKQVRDCLKLYLRLLYT